MLSIISKSIALLSTIASLTIHYFFDNETIYLLACILSPFTIFIPILIGLISDILNLIKRSWSRKFLISNILTLIIATLFVSYFSILPHTSMKKTFLPKNRNNLTLPIQDQLGYENKVLFKNENIEIVKYVKEPMMSFGGYHLILGVYLNSKLNEEYEFGEDFFQVDFDFNEELELHLYTSQDKPINWKKELNQISNSKIIKFDGELINEFDLIFGDEDLKPFLVNTKRSDLKMTQSGSNLYGSYVVYVHNLSHTKEIRVSIEREKLMKYFEVDVTPGISKKIYYPKYSDDQR